MRDIVASIHPRHAQAILDGTKTVELRRKIWRSGVEVDRMYIYETTPTRLIVGHVAVVHTNTLPPGDIWYHYGDRALVTAAEFDDYFSGAEEAHALVVGRPFRYDHPYPIAKLGLRRPPQSWCYVPEPAQ